VLSGFPSHGSVRTSAGYVLCAVPGCFSANGLLLPLLARDSFQTIDVGVLALLGFWGVYLASASSLL
jgi:hypothetical protein